MRPPRSIVALAALGVAAAFGSACQALLDTDLTDVRRPADGEAPDGSAGDPCSHARPPPEPGEAGPGEPTLDGGPLTFAIREFFFGEPDGGAPGVPLGFDLDRVCTCTPGAGAAFDGGASCVGPTPTCDDDAGRDLAGNGTFETYAESLGSTGGDDRIASGQGTMLFELRNYRGRDDEKQLLLWVFTSNGIIPTTPGGRSFRYVDAGYRSADQYCYFLADGGCDTWIPPKWDGNDSWTVAPSAFILGSDLPAVFASGYSAGGLFVFQRETLPIVINFGVAPIPLTFDNAIVAARLLPGPRLVGRINGRIAIAEVLAAAGNVTQEGTALCTQDFAGVKSLVCGLADIMSTPGNDNRGASCDALSLSLGFVAEPARRGLPLPDAPDASANCPPETRDCDAGAN